ncbi:hypothetical protein FXO38_26970 [Capsicum annuum]|nr:hypothetical protein FXO38_26970 [Capsicum annuum]
MAGRWRFGWKEKKKRAEWDGSPAMVAHGGAARGEGERRDGEELVPINSDRELIDFVKNLKDGDELDVFLLHGIDEDIEVVSQSSLLLEGPPVCIDEDDISSDGNEVRGLDDDLNGNELDVPNTDSDVEILTEDGSDIDDELRAFRAERHFQKKKDKYVDRLGGDEEFIDNSNCDSIDNTDLVDGDVVVGAHLPRRRKRSKIRFDDDYGVVVFELGMIFNSPKEFRKSLGSHGLGHSLKKIEKNHGRTVDMIRFANTWICDISPMARLILEENNERARACKANITCTNHIIWTMGTDFKYQYSHTWFRNIDKLIHYVNQDGRANALYSSPSIYTDARYAMDKYADRINAYWTGFFTSRPALKLYVRMMSGYYLAARQLEFFKGRSETGGPTTEVLADALAISQHNDAVSGTSKQYVANDYAKPLFIGYKQADDIVSSSLTCMVEPVSASGCKLAKTFMYLALEYAVTGKITIKADVFSFGVVLMELLSGWMALDEDKPNESQYLVAWNIKSFKEKRIATIDPALDVKQESTLDSIYTVAKLIGHCTTREPGQRPDMSHVVNMFATTSVVLITVFHSTKWSKAGKNRKEKT